MNHKKNENYDIATDCYWLDQKPTTVHGDNGKGPHGRGFAISFALQVLYVAYYTLVAKSREARQGTPSSTEASLPSLMPLTSRRQATDPPKKVSTAEKRDQNFS